MDTDAFDREYRLLLDLRERLFTKDLWERRIPPPNPRARERITTGGNTQLPLRAIYRQEKAKLSRCQAPVSTSDKNLAEAREQIQLLIAGMIVPLVTYAGSYKFAVISNRSIDYGEIDYSSLGLIGF